MTELHPARYKDSYLYWLGLLMMVINKGRYAVRGYRRPRPFSSDEIVRSINYCCEVVNNHEMQIGNYRGLKNPFRGKRILEIGPGPDLGTGICIMAKGADSYTAFDKYHLITQTNENLYDALFEKIKDYPAYRNAVSAYDRFKRETGDAEIVYIHDEGSDMGGIPDQSMDIVLSQAVLQQVSDVRDLLSKVKMKLDHGAIASHLIDCATQTRYIRNIDPCNILRYSDVLYKLLAFAESPNRLSASQYLEIVNQLGFRNSKIMPAIILAPEYISTIQPNLAKNFRSDQSRDVISFYLLSSV